MLIAQLQPAGRIAFQPWQRTPASRWVALPNLGSGDARGYREIGELLGVASAGLRIPLGAPVLHARTSEVTVVVRDLPSLANHNRPSPPGRAATRRDRAGATRRGATEHLAWWRWGPWVAFGVPVLMVAARIAQVRRRRRRRLRGRRTTVRLPDPLSRKRARTR